MTYSGDSPIMGRGLATAAAVDGWFKSYGNDPAGLGDAIVTECATYGVNSDLVAAQVAHETGYWTSTYAVQRNNPAGIGAVNDNPGQALSFPTVRAGIHAQVAHLLSYVLGAANPIKADDPRYAAMPADYLGSVKTLSDLNGKWAVPGVGYGAAIAAAANALVAYAVGKGETMASGRDPQAQWAPSSNFDAGRSGYVVDHITDHLTAGTNSLSWLRGAAGGSSNTNSSCTYLIARDGTVYQLVDEGDTPWTDGNYLYNQTGITIEHEAESGQVFTDAQVQASIALHARIAQRQGWTKLVHPPDTVEPEGGPPGTANVIGHYQVPDPHSPNLGGGGDHHTNCPGPLFPWQQIIDGANAVLAGAQPTAAGDTVTLNGHVLGHGFKAFWDKFGGLPLFGYPITEEVSVNGLTVQYFERARFEWHPGSDPSRFDVMLGLVGAELLAAKGGKP